MKIQTNHKRRFSVFAMLSNIVEIATSATPFLEMIEQHMAKQADTMLRRMMSLAVAYFALLAGIFIFVSGIILLILDFTAIPRGVVFILGGLLFISSSALFMRLSQK